MPPKAKFTKDEIIEGALDIVRTEGFEALTSRALGKRLNSSARPIFTVFQSMDEVQSAVIGSAKALYKKYVDKGLTYEHPFKGVGTQYILFSVNEPKLFQLLFMTEQPQTPLFNEGLSINVTAPEVLFIHESRAICADW